MKWTRGVNSKMDKESQDMQRWVALKFNIYMAHKSEGEQVAGHYNMTDP